MSNLPERLKALRIKHKMTQSELAEKIFASVQSVSRWETGESEPSLDALALICDVFDVSSDSLIREGNASEAAVLELVTDYIASGEEFARKAFGVCGAIPGGRVKRRSVQCGIEIKPGEYREITDGHGLTGVWSVKPEYPKLFALAEAERLVIADNDAEKIRRVLSLLVEKDNIGVLLKCQNADGWYDEVSLKELFGCSDERLSDILVLLKELDTLRTAEVAVNNSMMKVHTMYFSYKIKLLLALAVTVFAHNEYSRIS